MGNLATIHVHLAMLSYVLGATWLLSYVLGATWLLSYVLGATWLLSYVLGATWLLSYVLGATWLLSYVLGATWLLSYVCPWCHLGVMCCTAAAEGRNSSWWPLLAVVSRTPVCCWAMTRGGVYLHLSDPPCDDTTSDL